MRRDAENRRLGRMGEEWVVEFEQRRLHDEARRPDLARKVEWIADTRGDGAGYDIASFNIDESPRLIEVKTTGLGKYFPFLVTANEVRVSEREVEAYRLYRGCSTSLASRASTCCPGRSRPPAGLSRRSIEPGWDQPSRAVWAEDSPARPPVCGSRNSRI